MVTYVCVGDWHAAEGVESDDIHVHFVPPLGVGERVVFGSHGCDGRTPLNEVLRVTQLGDVRSEG